MIITNKKDIPKFILEKFPSVFKMIKFKNSNQNARLCIDPDLVFYETNSNNPNGLTHTVDVLGMREYFESIPPVAIKISPTFGITMATYDGNHRIRTIKFYNDNMEELGFPKIYLPIELIIDE